MFWLILTNIFILLNVIPLSNVQEINSIGQLRKRVMLGQNAELFEFPFQVAVQERLSGRWVFLCGGVLVTEKKVLTAADCFDHLTANNVRVIVGVLNIYGPPNQYQQTIYVSNIHKHESIEDELQGWNPNNIAVITLATAAKLNLNVQLAKLAENSTQYTDTNTHEKWMKPPCLITGWGYTENIILPNTLQKASTRIMPINICQNMWPSFKDAFSDGLFVCIKSDFDLPEKNQYNGPCYGDGGGPLMCGLNNQNLELVGIGCFVEPTCTPSPIPAVYVNLPAYRKWLSDKL
ncbi:fibrinolytic enzyme, isozyme C-like [Biomphalaria glabrata]|uniref:Fibrinolytic enzyme, isozyme C-like n=1 Tax=Biomphalaria glabrata TaxID=6526 RepID=A0A9W2YCL0_BIOGL|nr:fibrinolytic enzyme, isozyme C-like [Biomphalaria glabrata]